MDCTNCGACCLVPDIPVVEGLDTVAPEFVDGQCLKHVDGHCVFFNAGTRRCDNYVARPYICKRFPVGSARCLYIRLWAEVALDWFAPGVPYPSEERLYAPFEPVMNDSDMTITSIPGYVGERVEAAIARYNDAVICAHCH